MLSVAEAELRLRALLPQPETELVPLAQAVGRRLASDVTADRDGPPFDRVAMDGFAVKSGVGGPAWTIRGLQLAGRPPLSAGEPGIAVEVATGAVLPGGCDAVIPYEAGTRAGDVFRLNEDQVLPVAGRHVHHRGADYRAGDTLVASGTHLRSTHLHSLATVGLDRVPVVRRPVWGLAVTGDELVEVTEAPQAWQIRRSNAAAITGEAHAWGLAPTVEAALPDEPVQLKARLERLLAGVDVLVLTGGVSAGALDLVPGVLSSLGVQTLFHKVAQRPGKPLWCGVLPRAEGRSVMVFGLPGNPVSSLFSFRRYVLPWLLSAEGRPAPVVRLKVTGLKPAPAGQTVFLPWNLETGLLAWKGSGDFLSLVSSTGFVEVGDDPAPLDEVNYYPWGE